MALLTSRFTNLILKMKDWVKYAKRLEHYFVPEDSMDVYSKELRDPFQSLLLAQKPSRKKTRKQDLLIKSFYMCDHVAQPG